MDLGKGIKIRNENGEQLSVLKDMIMPEVFETFTSGYMLMDIAGNILYINSIAKTILECDLKKDYTNVRQLIHKKDFASAMKSFMDLIKKGVYKDYKFKLYTPSGSLKTIRIDASIIYNALKKPIAAHGTMVEYSEIISE